MCAAHDDRRPNKRSDSRVHSTAELSREHREREAQIQSDSMGYAIRNETRVSSWGLQEFVWGVRVDKRVVHLVGKVWCSADLPTVAACLCRGYGDGGQVFTAAR